MSMTAAEIRQTFLDFFKSKEHLIVPSAPLVVKNDPTLMFTNAGMNQFKDYFLGNRTPPSKRIADTQKCLRVSGKHNDLEEVGHDTYHHTMFEMLGNWSFGDYFKKEAIAWSWELLTDVYGIPKDRLYVTVFEGDSKEGIPPSSIALAEWEKIVDQDRIVYGNKKDNFWEMGDTGPCGPCTEIHVDCRPDSERANTPGRELVNKDHPQVIEIWNNVFIQYNRKADGSLEQLPATHVDTGMGFERLVRVIQGKQSNYDTDVFMPMISAMASASGKKYGDDEHVDVALRVLADHIRAISFAISDGQLPGNVKAGYVIRRILRRAIRYYFRYLDQKQPFIHRFVENLAHQFRDVFPELEAQKSFVARVIEEEEASFLRTLENGERRIAQLMALAKSKNEAVLSGSQAFELYDTFGFPLDLTALIARESGFMLDESGFENEMQAQKERSRKASEVETTDWHILEAHSDAHFVGYDLLESETAVLKYRKQVSGKETILQVVLEHTPFYGESGGQMGDKGLIALRDENSTVLFTLEVLDTKKENDLIIQLCKYSADAEKFLKSADNALAQVNGPLRHQTASNHSATHLLHSALRETLGSHIAQKGSLVAPNQLRFDFSHFSKVTDEELKAIEIRVNEKIREDIALQELRNVPIAEATKMGATALFGDKYGEFVRVIIFDPAYSMELCGGTHVKRTGEIGWFKLVSESSVAAGVRRIEALTGDGAQKFVNQKLGTVDQISEILNNPKDLTKAIQALLAEKDALTKKVEEAELERKQQVKLELISKAVQQNGATQIIAEVKVGNADTLKQLAFELKEQYADLFLVLASAVDGKPQLAVMIGDELLAAKGLNASNIARELAKEIKGGGGGQPFFATAGGSDVSGIGSLVEKAKGTLV
jgi:alanyl-tRNA synthetase